MTLRWQREGFSRWTEPETWVLVGPPLYAVHAKLVLRDGRWCADDPALGPWPAAAFTEATTDVLKSVTARGVR